MYLPEKLNAELFVLNAVDVDQAFRTGIHFGDAVETLKKSGKETLATVAKMAKEKGIRHEEFLVRSRTDEAIIKALDEFEALMIVGSTGMSGVEHVLFGASPRRCCTAPGALCPSYATLERGAGTALLVRPFKQGSTGGAGKTRAKENNRKSKEWN